MDRISVNDWLLAKKFRPPFDVPGVSEFSSYEIELQNRVKQNDVALRVTNSEIFIEILLSSY